MAEGRFDKVPEPERMGILTNLQDGTRKPVYSPAHLCRILYAAGQRTKAQLAEFCAREISMGGSMAQIEGWRDALDEVNGLPDDPPQT
jgi:hypothetical protein